MLKKESLKINKILRRLTVLLSFVFLLVLLTSCTKDKGLKTGFNYDLNPDVIMLAAKSKETDFNTDDITLDFYYGAGGNIGYLSDENYERVGFAVYFNNSKYMKNLESITTLIEDYQEIEGYYFVKEIKDEEFNSEDYAVEVKMFKGKTFNHHETLTVPKEVLELSEGYFCLTIMEIYYSIKDDSYIINEAGFIALHYEYVDDQTVRLSIPKSSVLSDPS